VAAQSIDIDLLKKKALTFRREILQAVNQAGSGHPGGSLSAVEILITLYECVMNFRAAEPAWEGRDRLIISKGHCTPVAYVTLAHYGFFPKDEIKTYRKFQTRLQGHVHTKVPGIEFNTGSLGHGLSVANGLALGARMLKKDFSIYCLMGDGEIQEGSVWEAAMTSAHHRLNRVCAVIDYNKLQENGPTNEIKNIEPLSSKWASFGWHPIEANGHDFHELISAFDEFQKTPDRPTVIIAHTVKGKGVGFMENQAKWHGKAPKDDQLEKALAELDQAACPATTGEKPNG